ncbi:GNAT family N-acetyltransferase [Flammeovirga yaeyamensis]|uniref:GNAT family N-acetyltransferase n=1 Tax=Flammeovirga yaeyamensis TaxID=367791 RepID=A0AAX1MY57_9BACT|nr:GNAT family protein [Flammeovirga yaeyamensis]MBB3696435.1 RimJ/RimL family protein N-acetyltransferase [Flammeovirga yaeyamensis]QWG00066.1 GNAT family N-acetyltransferase [Flammeovirga yaeyamensis]
MEISTQRLFIRPLSIKDAEQLFDYRSNKIANQYQSWIPDTIEDTHHFIRKLTPTFNLPNTWFQLAIIEQNSEIVIGDLGIHFIDNNQIEIGYTLSCDYQGKGYATEAVKSIIDVLFHKLKKHRISASLDPNNSASIKLLERLGFRKEAHHIDSYFHNDKWVDDVIYALLKREWKK